MTEPYPFDSNGCMVEIPFRNGKQTWKERIKFCLYHFTAPMDCTMCDCENAPTRSRYVLYRNEKEPLYINGDMVNNIYLCFKHKEQFKRITVLFT